MPSSRPGLSIPRARRSRVLVLSLCLFLVSQPALAEEPRELTNEAITNLYDQATAAVDAGDPGRARQIFLEIWPQRQTYDVAMNLGYVELKLGNFPGAAHYLRHALDHFPPTERLEVRREIETDLAQVTQRVATIHLSVTAPGANVAVDGVPSGKAPLDAPLFLAPGRHTLGAALNQGRAERSLEFEAGQEYRVVLELSETEPTALESGTSAPASEPEGVNETEGSRSWVPVYVGGTVVVAAFVTGGILSASAKHDAAALKDLKQQGGPHACVNESAETAEACAERSDLASSIDWKRNLSTASFVTGIGAAVFTLGYLGYQTWIAPDGKHGEPSLVFRPDFSPHRVSLELRTKF
ncbi:MAG TPA: hypothetical protein VI197_12520 [Polyangiaceae bacterium]